MSEAADTIQWITLVKILVSWILSPVIAGSIAASIYYFMRVVVLLKADSQSRALLALPILYAFTMGLNVYAILHAAPSLGWTSMPRTGILLF